MESVLPTIIETHIQNKKRTDTVRFFMFGFVSIFVKSAVVVEETDWIVVVVVDTIAVYVSNLIVALVVQSAVFGVAPVTTAVCVVDSV